MVDSLETNQEINTKYEPKNNQETNVLVEPQANTNIGENPKHQTIIAQI
jgi:hypothetical protein